MASELTKEMPKESRCPACNPLHEPSGFSRMRKGKPRADNACPLCDGRKLVPVAVSMRYVDAVNASTFE